MSDVWDGIDRANATVRQHLAGMMGDHLDRVDRVIEQQAALAIIRVGESAARGAVDPLPEEAK